MYILDKNNLFYNIKKIFIKITSGFTIGAILGSPVLLNGCDKVTETSHPTLKPAKTIENVIPTPTFTKTPEPTPSLKPTLSPTAEPTIAITPNPTPTSGICTYAEEATITQHEVEQICVAKFKVDGKEKRAFFISGISEKGDTCFDVFTSREIFYDLPNTFIPAEETKQYMKGKFEAIGYNGLHTYLEDIGVDKPLIEIKTYRDLRILYEQVIPKEQWFIVPWNPVLNKYLVCNLIEGKEKVLGKRS